MFRALTIRAFFILLAAGMTMAPALADEAQAARPNGQSPHAHFTPTPSQAALHLTDAQREQIRKAVLTDHTEVEFQIKAAKPGKDFTPSVGATLPKGLNGHTLPAGVLQAMPALRDYAYLKMKDEVLIVNMMTRRIVDMFSETQPLT